MRGRLRARAARSALAFVALASALPAWAEPRDEIARGDAAWASRSEGAVEGVPPPDRILVSIDAYQAALASDLEDLEALWKLLRSLHFAGEFLGEREGDFFERARETSERGGERLAARLGADPESIGASELVSRIDAAGLSRKQVARVYFWTAINWGAWSREAGLLAAVRRGAAGRLRSTTEVALVLEPAYEDGGPLRMMGRLHGGLPRVPFLSGWVDRDQALPLLERALEIAPEHPGNRLLLAITLLDLAPERRPEAMGLLEGVSELRPRPEQRVEDLSIQKLARERLAEERGDDA